MGNSICLQKCTEVVSCGCLCQAAAACTLHSGFTGSEIRVCKCPYASSPSTVSEDSRAGKRLRLILVLRETNVESGPAESSTTTLIEGFLLWE